MNILIITKRFTPESMAAAAMSRELAEELSRQGCQVTVIAGYPYHPYGRLFPGYRKKWVSIEKMDGFTLLRGWHLINPSHAIPIRALVDISKCLSYLISSRYSSIPDVIISFEGEPLVGPLVSSLIARKYGAKSVNLIFDIFPDIAIELKKLTNPVLIAIAKKLEKTVYAWSDKIVVLSEGFRRNLVEEKGVASDKVVVIPVWLDSQDITPMSRDNPWRRAVGIPPEKFVVLYAGTIGLVSGAEVIVEVAQSLTAYQDILFLMVGDGYGKEQVQASAQKKGLSNIQFQPFQPRERLSELQATADISLVTLAPGRGRTSVPSKVLGYMAAARPIIAAVDLECDTADMIRMAKCGVVATPGNRDSIAQAIFHYYNNPVEGKVAGQSGRDYFVNNFEKKMVIKKHFELIQSLFRS